MRIPRLLVGIVVALTPSLAAARSRAPDTLRYPYTPGAVYRLRLVPGSPFVVDLPTGETAKNVWCDQRYWMAETAEGSGRVVIRPIGSSDVVGKRGLIHIETTPSDLRISLKVEAVPETEDVSAALQVYVEGSVATDSVRQQVRKGVDAELMYARKHAEERARAEFDAWKIATLANFRDNYQWGGDFRITRVVDNKVQTYITVPDGSDKAVIHYFDKSGKREIVNYDMSNGTYVVQNKVLRPGEKFRLVLGKEQAWVALK
jgi:type IV secretory pathway VirB9-like protein